MTSPKPIVTLGECMGLFANDPPGPLALADRVSLSIGGAEANVAIGLARLGTPSVYVGRVGNDSIGRRVARELSAEGVGTHLLVDPDAPTGLMVRERRTTQIGRVSYYRADSAGSRLAPDDLPLPQIRSASVLHVTGITPALSPDAAHAVRTALDAAVSSDVPVSFDLNHRSNLWRNRNAADVYRDLAHRATILFTGFEEGKVVFPDATDARDMADRFAALGPSQVVIKLGENGALALIHGDEYVSPAHRISVVDPVGAGDAFVAGYLAEYVSGADPVRRLATAAACGAFACLNIGDWEGFPSRDDLAILTAAELTHR